ncbi:MAG TPA: hypothetical protein VJI69_09805 [Bacteroidia bacterium]|nr:hypothetical protein [Bacteroidia bacterium]
MKKVLLFVAVVTAASFASCKKDRVCTCTNTDTPTGGTATTTTSVITYTEAKKGDARSQCLSGTQTYTGGVYSRECTLN